MLQKKIDRAATLYKENISLFRCHKCQSEKVRIVDHSMVCDNGHTYNLSKKGTFYFLDKKIETEYNHQMLLHRKKMIQTGMYTPMLEKISHFLPTHSKASVLDVGCGEGSFLAELNSLKTLGPKIGFDISKEGVELATNQPVKDAMWLVADLTRLPIADDSIHTVLNIFSPSHYQEFSRVLAKDGQVIKIIPEENYLKELRLRVMEGTAKETYSNQKVYQRFQKEMSVGHEERISYSFKIPDNRYEDFIFMSPLHWQASDVIKKDLLERPIREVTVDVRLLVGTF